jgi:hypothetical protein
MNEIGPERMTSKNKLISFPQNCLSLSTVSFKNRKLDPFKLLSSHTNNSK